MIRSGAPGGSQWGAKLGVRTRQNLDSAPQAALTVPKCHDSLEPVFGEQFDRNTKSMISFTVFNIHLGCRCWCSRRIDEGLEGARAIVAKQA
jgi:hypothetical protein